MVKLPTAMLPQVYTQFMEQIKVRLDVAQQAVHHSYAQREHMGGRLHAEFAYLQVRRATEIVAVAVLVAHNEFDDFRTSKLTKEWNPDALFNRLTKLNKDGFPLPFLHGKMDEDDKTAELLIQDEGYLTREAFCRIYHDCCRRLHAGSLKDLIEGRQRYDLGEIQDWIKQLMRLLNNHWIILPERKRTMTVLMAVQPDGRGIAEGRLPVQVVRRPLPPHEPGRRDRHRPSSLSEKPG